MFTVSAIWIVSTNDGQFLGGRTAEDKAAAAIFKTKASAQRFIDGKKLSGNHRPQEIPQDDLTVWLQGVIKQGFTELYVDPDPSDTTHRCIPTFAFLTEVEAHPGEELPGSSKQV